MAQDERDDLVETAKILSAEQITGIQHSLRLSDEQLAEVMGFSQSSGERRIRRWKSTGDDAEAPGAPAAKLLVLLYKLDGALRVSETGDLARAIEMVRDAVPDVLQ